MNYVTGDNIAFIAYTIGSDGRPAGISLTHQALINSGRGLLERFVIRGEDNLIPGLLPAEANNACFAVAPHLLTGAILNFPEKPETTAHDIREINPDFVTYSPQQWENLAAQIRTKIGRSNPFMAVGYKFADCKMQNKKPNILWRLLHIPASLLFFRPLRNQFGLRRVRCAAVNGQIADLETFRLLHAAGIPLRQSYALTETGLTACQGRDDITFENAGRPSVNTELRITAQNELLVRNSSMFNGYHNDPQKTAAVLIDGWYHTGIAANIDGKGHLIILNRNSTQAK
jgi:long-chain acyl-CoA synthetase